jgi:hypothetical protein
MSNIRPSNLPIEETDLIGFVHTDRGVAGSAKFNLANVSSALNLDGMATQAPSAVAITGGTINGTTIGGTTAAAGTFTNLTGSTKVATPFVDATTSAGGQLRNASGTSQLAWGAGGGSNLSLEVATNINPANGSVSIAPTGTGTVTINPATAGTVNNMAIGGTTAAAGAFTTLSSSSTTTLNGTTIPASSTLLVSGGALGTPSSGTVTNLTGTASININGTVGATTPSTGAFTTLSSTGITSVAGGQYFSAGASGGAAPSFNTRSAGLKYNLFDQISATTMPFGLGIDSGAMWLAAGSTVDVIKHYVGTTLITTTSSTGLAVTGAISATGNVSSGVGLSGASGRHVVDMLQGGYSVPGDYNTAANGDKFIAYLGDSYDARIGVGTSADMWFKSAGNATASFGFYTGTTTLTKRVDISSTGLAVTGNVSTTDPAGGAGPAWKLGVAATVSPTSPNRTIRVEIGGTSYYIAAKTTND